MNLYKLDKPLSPKPPPPKKTKQNKTPHILKTFSQCLFKRGSTVCVRNATVWVSCGLFAFPPVDGQTSSACSSHKCHLSARFACTHVVVGCTQNHPE